MADSVGIPLIARLFVRIRDMHGTSVAYGADKSVKDIVEVLNLSDFVVFRNSEREALAAIVKG